MSTWRFTRIVQVNKHHDVDAYENRVNVITDPDCHHRHPLRERDAFRVVSPKETEWYQRATSPTILCLGRFGFAIERMPGCSSTIVAATLMKKWTVNLENMSWSFPQPSIRSINASTNCFKYQEVDTNKIIPSTDRSTNQRFHQPTNTLNNGSIKQLRQPIVKPTDRSTDKTSIRFTQKPVARPTKLSWLLRFDPGSRFG